MVYGHLMLSPRLPTQARLWRAFLLHPPHGRHMNPSRSCRAHAVVTPDCGLLS